jgi:ABC-type amino acid transport substrate-binding protein
MIRTPFGRFALAAVLSFGLVAAACSSDDDTAETTAAETAAAGAETATAETAETTETTAAEDTIAGATDTSPADSSVAETVGALAIPATASLKKAGTLTACTDIPYAPFEYEEDGVQKGIDIDLLKAMAAKLGAQAEFVDTDFDGIFAAMGVTCDLIISSVTINDERKQRYDFTDGYFTAVPSILVRKGEEGTLKELVAFKDKKFGVQTGTTFVDIVKAEQAAGGFQIVEFQAADEMLLALTSGQIDGLMQDSPISGYQATTQGDVAVSKVFEGGDQYGIVLPKGSELVPVLDGALAAVRADGTYDTIVKTYLGELPTA